jgi:hypothetical protein
VRPWLPSLYAHPGKKKKKEEEINGEFIGDFFSLWL